jgi:hypothetical protein
MRGSGRGAILALLMGAVLVCAAPPATRAQEAPAAGTFPQIAGEVWMGLHTVGNDQAPDRERRGSSTVLFGEVAGGLSLSPSVAVQSVVHVDPVGEVDPHGTVTGFRGQGTDLEALFLDWRPSEQVRLYGGGFSAPFGDGHHVVPGILPMIRTHAIHLIRGSNGVGGAWTWLSDAVWGEHDLSAAVCTFDTSVLSNTAVTRKRCCQEGFERFRRNVLHQGGAGNNGNFDSFAIALDGDRIGAFPNFTHHAARLSRGPGRGGLQREGAWVVGARYLARWTADVGPLFFGESVEFRNAGGGPLEEAPPGLDAVTGEEIEGVLTPLREMRRFSTLGAQTATGP